MQEQTGNSLHGPIIYIMDVPDQFLKIGVLQVDDGFEPVLEPLTMSAMSQIQISRIAGQKSSHEQ
ncbi:MAG: hypothetical protein KJ882_03295 [Proteobacteria bacterium]|nr:hypothetical protein [Pseudomonadota bacterium]